MSVDANWLINGHLDGTLTTDERAALAEWLKASSEMLTDLHGSLCCIIASMSITTR